MSLIKKIKAKIAIKRFENFLNKHRVDKDKIDKMLKAVDEALAYLKDRGFNPEFIETVEETVSQFKKVREGGQE